MEKINAEKLGLTFQDAWTVSRSSFKSFVVIGIISLYFHSRQEIMQKGNSNNNQVFDYKDIFTVKLWVLKSFSLYVHLISWKQ